MASSGMTAVQILVRARGLDPVLVSAEHALRARLGFEGRLARLGRGDLWAVEACEGDAASLVERLVTATGLLVNPNRHRFVWRALGETGDAADWGSGSLASGARSRAFILVAPLEARAEEWMITPLARALGERAVTRIERMDLWTMDLTDEEEAAGDAARDAATARSRREGLLANPHYQRAAVHTGVLPAAPLRGLIDGRVR